MNYAFEYCQLNKIIVMFAYYLIYEHIHPYEDGNERVEWLLLLENIYNNNMYYHIPLSNILRHKKQAKYLMNEIFKRIDIGEIMKKC